MGETQSYILEKEFCDVLLLICLIPLLTIANQQHLDVTFRPRPLADPENDGGYLECYMIPVVPWWTHNASFAAKAITNHFTTYLLSQPRGARNQIQNEIHLGIAFFVVKVASIFSGAVVLGPDPAVFSGSCWPSWGGGQLAPWQVAKHTFSSLGYC